MSVTINVNMLSLVHEDSNGTTIAFPDVCKTPSPPSGTVPIPYPNIAMSSDLDKGTKKVKVDGGNPAAIQGSEFSSSKGDEAGVAGGIVSGVNEDKATWILFSFNVFMEGKNACRLMDIMSQNKDNIVGFGILQEPVI